MDQLTDVVDAAGNRTQVGYDLLGRRTRLDNPDAGLVELFYDLAGNLTRKVDANLRAQGRFIEYVYDFERPAEVHYADARRNVAYAYGPPGAPENAAARIVRVTDEVGAEERGHIQTGSHGAALVTGGVPRALARPGVDGRRASCGCGRARPGAAR